MEMETSTMSPRPPRLTVDEDALASQVLEIIGGFTLENLQTLEKPEEREVWLMEEGDDSVFYSDEDQAHQDVKSNMSCDFGASECKRLVNSVTSDEAIPQREDDPGENSITNKGNSEMEKEVTQQVILTEQGDEGQPKTEPTDQTDAANPERSNQTPEKSMATCGESLQLNCASADMQTEPEQNTAAEKAIPQKQEEEGVPNMPTPNLQPFDVTNEESHTRLNGEAEVSEQMSGAEQPRSDDSQLQVNEEPEQKYDIHVPMGFHQDPSPGYSTLPLPKKSGTQKSFDHLSAASKYSTVSYRKIRRGNTRQKIDKFEYLMNL